MENENLKPIEKLTPFTKMIMTIGTLPSSFYASMSYYESMVWLYEYLKNQVIPTVNNNAEAVEELQTAFTTLETFISEYFDNLDVQEEINTKLDEMAEDGSLTNLIKGYVDPIYEAYEEELNGEFNDYKTELNGSFNDYKDEVNGTLTEQNTKINNLVGNNPIFVSSTTAMTDQSKIYVLTTDNHIYQYINGSFTDTGAVYSSQDDSFQIGDTLIKYDNYGTLLPDLDNATSNKVYSLFFSNNTSSIPAHYPTYRASGTIETLIVVATENPIVIKQLFFNDKNVYERWKYANQSWQDWKLMEKEYYYGYLVNNTNYETVLPDLNNLTETKTYTLLFSSTGSTFPANLPEGKGTGNIDTLMHIDLETNHGRAVQLYFTNYTTYYRYKISSSWRPWKNVNEKGVDVQVSSTGDSGGTNGNYNTLKGAVEYATRFKNSTVRVRTGTYDLYQEFGGNDFFNTYTSTSSKGLYLKNGVHLIFDSDTKVVFNNTSGNTEVDDRFSPFNTDEGGFILENCTLEATHCRYGIHDDVGNTDYDYINIIKNCNITMNTDGSIDDRFQCIGGGFGRAGNIIIENCYFYNPNALSTTELVSYHNNYGTQTSKSNLVIKDCYFETGTIRISWCGTSTDVSNCYITNNKLNSSIIHRAENSSHTTLNTKVIAWNNITE